MKKTTLFLLAAGALVFTTMPATAQTKATTQEVKKEATKSQVTKAATTAKPAAATTAPAATAKPAAAAVTTVPPVPGNTSAAVVANPSSANQVVVPTPPPAPLTCTWDITDYDFGKNVIQLKPASATFTLTNAGKDPVTITQVSTSCGCTAPKYNKEPIKPGEKGEVVLTYNAAVSGTFAKSAQVKLNDGQNYTLTIKGEVQKIEQTPPPPATIK